MDERRGKEEPIEKNNEGRRNRRRPTGGHNRMHSVRMIYGDETKEIASLLPQLLVQPPPPGPTLSTLLPTTSPIVITCNSLCTTPTHLFPDTRILSPPADSSRKPSCPLFSRLHRFQHTQNGTTLSRTRVIAPNHFSRVVVPIEATHFVVL